ncbi:MAG TPA: fumarate reductase/succinate dehydrogenase flavoprotein subunit [Acidimicrobiales bacterium]|nr:fumarate reductase/succinate dehydrogenase flavoprotein subunit [Acidimicrobiales bacterium]
MTIAPIAPTRWAEADAAPLDGRVPPGPIAEKWDQHKFEMKLINPANKRRYHIIMVGSGLAGASAAASLADLGYRVSCFCYQDSPRRAHSIAAQGGINAAKNYPNDGDSVYRLFYDTVKGGDYRSREANVYRLAQISVDIIDQCVAQGVPFAREYGGLLDNRSFGGAQVSRTFYARGQTGQQLLLGAYQALARQIGIGGVTMHPRTEMLDLVIVDGQARGIVTRDMVTGEISSHVGDAVVLATGGYGNVFYLSTNAKGCNTTAIWRAHRRGALFANPCYTQIHPTCIPVSGDHQSKLTLMSESLRNDGRIWVPLKAGDTRPPDQIPEEERDYFLERKYPSFGNLVPRDVASRNAKEVCDEGRGVGPGGRGVYLDLSEAIGRLGLNVIRERYGNLFDMYERITGEDPYKVPMRIYPAIHYTMGGLWVDYNLMSNIAGLFVLGEANFSDHGANRLGASALMQGLSDGYFVVPYTVGDYLATAKPGAVTTEHPAFKAVEAEIGERTRRLLSVRGNRTVDQFHRELGLMMWEHCGMARNEAGLNKLLDQVPALREEFWRDVNVPGSDAELNQALEKAGRVADFLEMAELLVTDALHRTESCGGHFREESQTPEGEALRDDEHFSYVAGWEWGGETGRQEPITSGPLPKPVLHKEPLEFEYVHLAQRSYK